MPTFTYQSAGNNRMVFASNTNPDHMFTIGAERSFSDSSKKVRYERLTFKENVAVNMPIPGCADACVTARVIENFQANIGFPVPYTEDAKAALVARWTSFSNNVLKALGDYNVASSSLPPSSATFDGTASAG